MNFKEALKELKNGEKITRIAWNNHQYIVIDKDDKGKNHVTSYEKHATVFQYDSDIMLSDEWLVNDDLSKYLSWAEIVEALSQGAKARLKDWHKDTYIIYDKTQKSLVRYGMEFRPYTPNFESFISNDWMVYGREH